MLTVKRSRWDRSLSTGYLSGGLIQVILTDIVESTGSR